MSSTNQLSELERKTMTESALHSMDGRVKLIILVSMVVYAVYTTDLFVLAVMEIYLIALLLVAHLPLKHSFMTILLILPFGGSIAVLQPFVHAGTIIYTLPWGIHVTAQGIAFAELLISRLIVSLTCIVILSSLSPMQEVADSFRRLGMPKDFAMILSLFIRFLFMFYDELERIRNAQKSRNFDIFSKETAYMWRLRQVAYTVMMMFLRAYEKGETVYFSMLSRGYSEESKIYVENKKMRSADFMFIGVTLALIVGLEFMKFSSLI